MTQLSEIQGDHRGGAYVSGQATAGAAKDFPTFRSPGNIAITRITWTPQAAVTGAATNNFALQAVNTGTAGVGTVTPTSTKTYASGTNSVALAPENLTLSATATDLNMTSGQVLTLRRTVNGTGLAMPEGVLEVAYNFR